MLIKTCFMDLTGIKGVSYTFSKAILAALGLDAYRKLGSFNSRRNRED